MKHIEQGHFCIICFANQRRFGQDGFQCSQSILIPTRLITRQSARIAAQAGQMQGNQIGKVCLCFGAHFFTPNFDFLGNQTHRAAFGSPSRTGICKMRYQGARPEQDDQADQIKAQIEENLKRVYQSALVEEVPDRFKLLLQQLKDKDAQNSGDAQNTGDAQNAGGQK